MEQYNEPLIKYFPVREVNEYSATEKRSGRPPHWETVFWWTRKPLASARAVIASALLPRDAYDNTQRFLNDLFPCHGEKKTVHNCSPSPRLIEKLRDNWVIKQLRNDPSA
ncbi:MAG: DUF1156 domain-containing protein [Vulcanisaeta sp.]